MSSTQQLIFFFRLFNFQDCHGSLSDNPAPIQDDTQNYMIDSGYQNATHTQVSVGFFFHSEIYQLLISLSFSNF